jgi:hypothetical protein
MGSSHLENLCKNRPTLEVFKTYVIGICKDIHLKVDGKRFTQALHANMMRNSSIVVYPFDGQDDIPPAFYDELPDPLPSYSVSGFPISISFNMALLKDVRLLEFKLFRGEKEITKSIIYSKNSDPNKKMKDGEYALFPLERLDWNTRYRVETKYLIDGDIYKKVWYFKTRGFKDKFYSVINHDKRFTITQGIPFIFYFPPSSKSDVFGDLKYPSFLDIDFIDKNTIRIVASNNSRDFVSLQLGTKILNLEIKKIN